jgi:hypothetical protein
MLLLAEAFGLLVSFRTHVVDCVHLEEVEPAFPLLILEVVRGNVNYSLVKVCCPVTSPFKKLLRLPLILPHELFLAYFAMRYPLS